MPCGRTSRAQFSSQASYDRHRMALLKLILGNDWQDEPLPKLIAKHPELRQLSLHELIAQHEHADDASPIRHVAIMEPREQPTASKNAPSEEPRAIESGSKGQSAEEWLKEYLREHDGAERED